MTQPPQRRPERALSRLLLKLRECACEELATTLAGPVCRCHLVHSEVEILDGCDCACPGGATGRFYVRVVRIEANTGITDQFVPCPPAWEADLELGVSRCVLDCKAELPSDEVLTNEALYALSDYAALKRAVLCCARERETCKPPLPKVQALAWRPMGPDGCCYGGALEVRAFIP